MSQQLLILGTGTFAQEIADVVGEIPGIEVAGLVELYDRARCEHPIAGFPVVWLDDLAQMSSGHQLIFGIGTTRRAAYLERLSQCSFATLVHRSAHVSGASTLGVGTFVSCSAIIGAHTKIGEHVTVNRAVLIGHHTNVGSFVLIGPGSNIAGNTTIGQGTYIGMGAIVLDHLTIGENSVIGAGAVVTKDVPANVQVVGVPARIVKRNVEGK